MTNTQTEIVRICDEIKELLLQKNRKYGDSAINPCRVLSKSSPVEQILVRLDDKLNRISQGAGLIGDDEDVINDIIGYFVLLKIALGRSEDAVAVEQPDTILLTEGLADQISYSAYLTDNLWDDTTGPSI